MGKHLLLIAALLCAGYVNADNSKANTTTVVDQDGFTEPMTKLKFNPGLDQREFERSTLNALNVYDPLESWNRRVCLLYTSPSPRDGLLSRMPSSA